ncbi:MAG: mechanosensitive ion channel protein MscS, partial [Legionellales bacterium]
MQAQQSNPATGTPRHARNNGHEWVFKNRFFCAVFVFLFFIVFHQQAHALPAKENNSSIVTYLTIEKTHLSADVAHAKQQYLPKNEAAYNAKKQHINTLIIITKAKTDSFLGFLDDQKRQQIHLYQRLKHLQQLPLASADEATQAQVSKVENALTVNKKTIELIAENLDLVRQFQNTQNDGLQQLELWHVNYQLEQKLKNIKKAKIKLNQDLMKLYQNNTITKSTKHQENSTKEQIEYESNLLINNQHITLTLNQLTALNLQKKAVIATVLLLKNSDAKTLQYVIESYTDTINQYSKLANNLQQMLTFMNNEAHIGLKTGLDQSIGSLRLSIQKQLQAAGAAKLSLSEELIGFQNQLKQLSSTRQRLAEYSMHSWPIIINKLIAIPSLFYSYMKTLTLKVYDSYLWLDTLPASILWTVVTLLLAVSFLLNRFLNSLGLDKERFRLTGYLYGGVLTLIQRNIPYLCVFSILWSVLYATNISFVNYQLLFNLLSVWLAFRVFILIARLVLLESIFDSSGKDVKLYYRLKWMLLFGGWTAALMQFSHLLPLPLLLQDIFNRLFMLFILSVSLVAWKSKDVIAYLLSPLLIAKKRYIQNAISLLVVLVPITLFTTAIIGLFGFVPLAWAMSRYQAYVLMVLVGYILSRGLLFDALELLSEWMISALRNGWLWIEVFLKPLDTILRVILLLFSIGILFQLFGWHSDSLVIINLEKIAQLSIINVTGIKITVASTIEFFVLLLVFIWASKWTREFCYRWLFIHTKDAGIRNSLSVFTQYS